MAVDTVRRAQSRSTGAAAKQAPRPGRESGHVADRLLEKAYLYDDPAAYEAGVRAALAAVAVADRMTESSSRSA